ncbi:hypothetical protein Tco_0824846 [Tanacetum coccineum]
MTSFPALPDFSSVFKFNDRFIKLETNLSKMKQVDQYAQAISSIPAIVDRYIDNKLGEAIHKAIQSHNAECREEAQAEKQESSSQPKSIYEAVASLSEYELTKILMDKMEESKSHLRDDYKRESEVFTLKRSRDEKDKDQDPSAGSDRGTKRRKSSKDAKPSRDRKSKESKSTSSSKVDDSEVKKNQEFNIGYNDEQPADETASKVDWYKKPERPPNPDPDWNKRQHVDFRPPQTWISVTARAEKPPTSFDELIDSPIDFSAFVMNRLNIPNLTQELLVDFAFDENSGLLYIVCYVITAICCDPFIDANETVGEKQTACIRFHVIAESMKAVDGLPNEVLLDQCCKTRSTRLANRRLDATRPPTLPINVTGDESHVIRVKDKADVVKAPIAKDKDKADVVKDKPTNVVKDKADAVKAAVSKDKDKADVVKASVAKDKEKVDVVKASVAKDNNKDKLPADVFVNDKASDDVVNEIQVCHKDIATRVNVHARKSLE